MLQGSTFIIFLCLLLHKLPFLYGNIWHDANQRVHHHLNQVKTRYVTRQWREHIWHNESWEGYTVGPETVNQSNPIFCHSIVNDRIHHLIKDIPSSLLIPYGRAYVGHEYGVALYLDTATLPSDNRFHVDESLSLIVRTCLLSSSEFGISNAEDQRMSGGSGGGVEGVGGGGSGGREGKNETKKSHFTGGECGISLYARLLGTEILLASNVNVIPRNITWNFINRSTCDFHITFPPVRLPGTYKPEILTMWLNEIDEPDAMTRNRGKNDRVNDGSIVNLSGMGRHNYYVLNATMHYYPGLFEGLTVRPHQSKSIYIIFNGTRRSFTNWGAFVSLGYDSDDIIPIMDNFLYEKFTDGGDITTSEGCGHLRKGNLNRLNMTNSEIGEIIRHMGGQFLLSFESRARLEAMVFGLPPALDVIDESNMTTNNNNNNNKSSFKILNDEFNDIPRICTRGDEPGRWMYEPYCEFNVTTEAVWGHFADGQVCRHALNPVYDNWDFDFHSRTRYHVWRPYNCTLIPYRANAYVFPNQTYCDYISYLIRSTVDQRAKEKAISTSSLGSNVWSIEPLLTNNGFNEGTLVKLKSLLAWGLRSAGMGLIAGFGDSLGEEQRDNVEYTLGSLSWGSNNALVCRGSPREKLHQLVHASDDFPLVSCVERMVNEKQLHGGDSIPLFLDADIEANPVLKTHYNLTSLTAPIKSVVLVTNFMSQHSVWIHTMKEIEEWLHKQGQAHDALTKKLKQEKNLEYRKIFLASIYVHGFRTGGLTPGRSNYFNNKAREILVPYGWEVLDLYNVSAPRPDGSVDGVHPRGGVSIAVTDILLNQILNRDCLVK